MYNLIGNIELKLIEATAVALASTNAPAPADPTAGISIIEKFIGWITDYGWIIAILCGVIACIMLMIPSEETQHKAKSYIPKILIGVAGLLIFPSLIAAIKNS